MGRDITISEGGVSRGFGGTRKLKTALQGEGADSCYWVPEIETRVNPVFIAENGIHEAAEAGEYGFSVAHVNIPEKHTDLDGNEWDITIDEDGIPHIEIEDIELGEIEITIDDEIGEIEINIDDQEIEIDPEELELDPDEDIDVSIDVDDLEVDIVGTDLDGEDVLVDLDLETLEFDTLLCPTEIKVMHEPNKTDYTDGETIDYDGLVVQIFDADGYPWSNKDYPDSYIPADKLTLKQYAEYTTDVMWYHATSDLMEDGINYTTSSSITIVDEYGREIPWTITTSGEGYIIIDKGYINKRYAYAFSSQGGRGAFTHDGKTVYYSETSGFIHFAKIVSPAAESFADIGYAAWTALYGESIPLDHSVPVIWNSPCYGQLETQFQINVTQREDHSGSHHSGKF